MKRVVWRLVLLAGALLGAGYALAFAWGLESVWQWAGRRWFSAWHARLPSLLNPPRTAPPPPVPARPDLRDLLP